MNHTTRKNRASGTLAYRQSASRRPTPTSGIGATTAQIIVLPTAFQKTGSAVSSSRKLARPTNSSTPRGLMVWTLL